MTEGDPHANASNEILSVLAKYDFNVTEKIVILEITKLMINNDSIITLINGTNKNPHHGVG